MDGTGLLDGKDAEQFVDALLGESEAPLLCVADRIAPLAAAKCSVFGSGDHVVLDILVPQRAVLVGVDHVDVHGHRGVVFLAFRHDPTDTFESRVVLGTFQGVVSVEEGGILGVMAVVLPSHEVDYLRHAERDVVHALDDFDSLFAGHPDRGFAVIAFLVPAVEFSLRHEKLGYKGLGVVVAGSHVHFDVPEVGVGRIQLDLLLGESRHHR